MSFAASILPSCQSGLVAYCMVKMIAVMMKMVGDNGVLIERTQREWCDRVVHLAMNRTRFL